MKIYIKSTLLIRTAFFIKTSLLFLMIFSIDGCVTAEQVNTGLQSWVGVDADELAAKWGAPNGNYEKKDGGRILTYDRSGLREVGGSQDKRTVARRCKINFTTDKDNKVVTYDWDGDKEECNAMIPIAQ